MIDGEQLQGPRHVRAEDVGQPLLSLPHGDGQELRLVLRERDGRRFFDLRVWVVHEGRTFPSARGVRFTAGDLAAMLRALATSDVLFLPRFGLYRGRRGNSTNGPFC